MSSLGRFPTRRVAQRAEVSPRVAAGHSCSQYDLGGVCDAKQVFGVSGPAEPQRCFNRGVAVREAISGCLPQRRRERGAMWHDVSFTRAHMLYGLDLSQCRDGSRGGRQIDEFAAVFKPAEFHHSTKCTVNTYKK